MSPEHRLLLPRFSVEVPHVGRPGCDPRDLLKLYLHGYMNQVRSSRRLEAECVRNVEVKWLLGRLRPDCKSIAKFRRLYREALSAPQLRGLVLSYMYVLYDENQSY